MYDGNTADPKTLLPQVEKVREQFGLDRARPGRRSRHDLADSRSNALRELDGVDWITALKTGAIAQARRGRHVQIEPVRRAQPDQLTHDDYPGERLVACRNPALAKLRAHKRQDLLAATERGAREGYGDGRPAAGSRAPTRSACGSARWSTSTRSPSTSSSTIEDGAFAFKVNDERVAAEAALDGLYVIRTSVAADRHDAPSRRCCNYKRLAEVERAFRTLKGVDLQVRPIRHRLEERVRAHIFLCMLAYYVQWHMIEAWAPLTFTDEAEADALRASPIPSRRPGARKPRSPRCTRARCRTARRR